MPKDLTQVALDRLKPEATRREIPDGAVRGLHHVIQPTGRRGWAYRYRLDGKTAKLTLGTFPTMDLKTARAKAREAAAKVEAGEDPNASKKAVQQAARAAARPPAAETTAGAIDTFITRHAKVRNRESVWKEADRILRRELAPWSARRLADLRPADIHDLLDRKMDDGAPASANRTLAVLRRFFRFAVERRIIETSPCAGIGAPAPTKSRERVLPDDELAAVWRGAAALGHPFGPMVRLLILTGARRGEVAGMEWPEVDFDAATWTIPAKKAKNGKRHVVHLAPVAADIIRGCSAYRTGSSVLGLGDNAPSGFSKAKARLDKGLGEFAAWTYHDLRRSVATGLARHGVPIPVVERLLNHVSGTFAGVVGTYQRHDFEAERVAALDAWAEHMKALTCPLTQ